MTTDGTITSSLNAQIGQRIFTKYTSSVHVGRQETTVAFQLLLRGQAAHVGRLHDMVKVFSQVPKICSKIDEFDYTLKCTQKEERYLQNIGVDIDLVLPFEFSPHTAELSLSAVCRVNVVHNINMNIVEHNTVAV